MIEPFLALKASAGSGKTFALSVRFIALILQKESVKSITALTFTKKAASEMSERIVNTFLNLEQKDAELAELCEILSLSKDEVLARRDEVKDEFLNQNLKIMTFDAFFGKILRSFSLNLGVSPDFKTSEIESEIFKSEFIKEISKNTADLRALASFIISYLNGTDEFFKSLASFYENLGEGGEIKVLNAPSDDEILALCADFRQIITDLNGSKDAQNAFKIKEPLDLLDKGFIGRESLNYKTFAKIYQPYFDEKFELIKLKLKDYINELERYKINELYRFLHTFKSVKFSLNRRLDSFSFFDITSLTFRLLTSIDKDMLYFRLDGKIKHLLIDEFQDTNVIQYEIINPLIAEIVAGYGQNGLGSFFYVGDIKQSIYRFRGGKKELFDKVASDFKQIKTKNLGTNYRSARLLVDYVNEIFKDKISDFKPQISNSKNEGFLRVTSSDEPLNEILEQTKWLLNNGVKASDITILCWKNSDINDICDALKAQNIDASDEGAMLLKNSPSVFSLINYAKFCLFGSEIFAKNFQTYIGFSPKKVSLNLSKTASECLKFLAKTAQISLNEPDVLKLFEISSGFANLVEFLFEFENSDEKSANNAVLGVRVMTTHKSKGLEFEHVILCDKFSKDMSDTSQIKIEYSVKNGYEVRLKLANREILDDDYKNFIEFSKELDRQEEINKLYVAMTRAKESLIIVKKDGKLDGNHPTYFSPYSSGVKNICYLDLKTGERGVLTPKVAEILEPKTKLKKIELVSVPKDSTSGDLSDDLGDFKAIYFGSALHFLLEISDFSETGILAQKDALFNKFSKFLSQDELTDVLNRAVNLVKNDEFIKITKDAKLKKEQPLNYDLSNKQIDLLAFKDSEIFIIDYKSSDKFAQNHILQVGEYVQIISKIYPNFSVKGVIFYILADKIEAKFV